MPCHNILGIYTGRGAPRRRGCRLQEPPPPPLMVTSGKPDSVVGGGQAEERCDTRHALGTGHWALGTGHTA